jgi:hypothetical protein
MTNQDQSDNARRPQPHTPPPDPHDAPAQDPRDAAVLRQIHADTEVNRQQAERLKATQPPDVDEKRVEEIAEDAEQRAKR